MPGNPTIRTNCFIYTSIPGTGFLSFKQIKCKLQLPDSILQQLISLVQAWIANQLLSRICRVFFALHAFLIFFVLHILNEQIATTTFNPLFHIVTSSTSLWWGGSLHSSMSGRWALDSSRVWDTFSGAALSLVKSRVLGSSLVDPTHLLD